MKTSFTSANTMKNSDIQLPAPQGIWKFTQNIENNVPDVSGNDHILRSTGNPSWVSDAKLGGAISFNGSTQWLSTEKPVLRTNESFSVAAWVRLDRTAMNNKLQLKPGENAITAVSQDSQTHSGFYLGVRRFEETCPDGTLRAALNWSFTLAPIEMSQSGVHARSSISLDDSALDTWVMLVGVCDVENRVAHIHVPSIEDTKSAYMPESWVLWRAEGGLQLGRGHWENKNVDQWPGSIGPVHVFASVLTEEEAKVLYHETFVKEQPKAINS